MNDPEYARFYEEAEAEQRLGQLVYDRRVALGLSQAELAERAGMTQPQVSRLETGGGNITVASLGRLAAALDADLTIGFMPHQAA
ncbi:helix-turn-helix transcriptional regulator [Nonomuraea sp. K274]|uniref:Helix-turn-helix transcriptional regulator n=2 Tax=Nonomuraea cypriaca TaxID=1187855 RepID=A0A931A8T2_9ACTN|nr:helix-turn-helix transcriptional regulator [Nonomuraea cypriaca]